MEPSFFYHTPENGIGIFNGKSTVNMLLSDLVYFEPKYVLESPYIWQHYVQGKFWSKYTSSNQYDFPIPWSDGDLYISKVDYYLNNLPIPPQTLPEAKRRRIQDIMDLRNHKFSSGIKYTLMNELFYIRYFDTNALIAYQNAGNVPVGFKIENILDKDIDIDLKKLLYLDSGIVDFNYKINKVVKEHTNNINLLTTIIEVMKYDISPNWPPSPYVI